MTKDLFRPIIRRSNLYYALIAFALIALVLYLAFAARNFYHNMFNGPFYTGGDALLDASSLDALSEYYVTVEGDQALDTGYYMTVTFDDVIVDARMNYGALLIEDQFLLYSTRDELGETINPVVTGTLTEFDEDAHEVLDRLYEDHPDLRGHFLPFMLQPDNFFQFNGIAGIGVEIAVLLGALWLLFRSFRFTQDLSQHPIMQSFHRYDPNYEREIQNLQLEIESPHTTIGNLHLTNHWLVHVQAANLQAMRLEDVVWMYRKTTQYRSYGIPTGKTCAAVFYDRHGCCFEVKAKEQLVDQMLEAVTNRSPFAFTGYEEQLDRMWKSQRRVMIAHVDLRINQMEAQA
jgi:hypothetical protein